MIDSLLMGSATSLLTEALKKTAKGFKELFSGDRLESALKEAFEGLKESVGETGDKNKEEQLLSVFEDFFRDSRTRGEFRQALNGKGEDVNVNLLREIFEVVCKEKKICVSKQDFFDMMEEVLEAMHELANLSLFQHKYLRQLISLNNKLQFPGIPDLREKKEIDVPNVFVMPRVKERMEVENHYDFLKDHGMPASTPPDDQETHKTILTGSEGEIQQVKFDRVLARENIGRLVVLGKPGSGKSILLKYLMLEAAQKCLENHRDTALKLPILLEIRRLEYAISKTSSPSYNILDFLYDSVRQQYNLTLPRGFFEGYLKKGRAFLLFDGLDEVASEFRRTEIRKMISGFIEAYHSGNQVIVTSRIAGYSRTPFSTSNYLHFTLEDFNEEEIEEFIVNWYRCRIGSKYEAERKTQDLKETLEKKPRIKELARNPLLLTIIGIIHRHEAQLPEDRLLLYDKATETLLHTWENVKDLIDIKFKLEYKRRFLEKVAFHLQLMGKENKARILMERQELHNILLPDFCSIFNCKNWQAKAHVNDFLEIIRLRSGLIVEQAPDQFGFLHKTFQEYFAAKWIANETLLKLDLKIMINYVKRFIGNAFWQETLLLALRALRNEHASNVLEYLLTLDPLGIETYFFHTRYFIMKFIAEQGAWLQRQDFVRDRILEFIKFSWNDGNDRGWYDNRTWGRFEDWINILTDTLTASIVAEELLQMAEDNKEKDYLRYYCVIIVGQVGNREMKKKAINLLLDIAEDEKKDINLRCDCAEAISQMKKQSINIKTLERLIKMTVDEKTNLCLRRSCAATIGQLEELVVDNGTIEHFLKIAESANQDKSLRDSCAFTVQKLGNKSQKKRSTVTLKNILGDRSLDNKKKNVSIATAGPSKGTALNNGDVDVKQLLILAADENNEGYLRHSSAHAVVQFGNHHQKRVAVEILLSLVEDKNQEGSTRISCATSVIHLGDQLQKRRALKNLLLLANDETKDGYLRRNSAIEIINLGDDNQKENALEILLLFVEDETQDFYLRRNCSYIVGQFGNKKQRKKAIDLLIRYYKEQKDKRSDDARIIYSYLWKLTTV